MLSPLFTPCRFDDLPGWRDDDHTSAFAAFRRSAFRHLEKPWKTGSLGVRLEAFLPAFAEARTMVETDGLEARAFFERHFTPARVTPTEGAKGLVTGFYEPAVAASPVRTARHTVPLLRPPADLVEVDDTTRPAGLDSSYAWARDTGNGLVEYFDRSQIEKGALDGRGLEIAWLESRVDAFFIHVQGAARLVMPDGAQKRVTFAAKSGQPFIGVGRILVARGEIPLEEISMQSIRAWLAAHPERADELLWQNRSYIFFREAPVDDPELGPVAAAKVPLTAGRSVAVDRFLHTFATPFFIHAPDLLRFGGKPFARLMIAQDTGTAIVGAARGDLFAGSGDAAGEIAGPIRNEADFYALLPNALI
ncbi:MAG: murein transglycosylase A [Notoacmeibacter sp.]|nr:murein transglycosylase A [Notoacmeibacter sp.]MCC0033527.1 murein transglycosylase A [Brucellaceae bacterium]